MKKFFAEFKEFALKGNVMDMAIGVIIGAAFKGIIDALIGAFIMAIINFIILAFVLFLMVKAMNKLINLRKKPEPEAEPLTKKCPLCQSEIDIKAIKCPHCTGDIQ